MSWAQSSAKQAPREPEKPTREESTIARGHFWYQEVSEGLRPVPAPFFPTKTWIQAPRAVLAAAGRTRFS